MQVTLQQEFDINHALEIRAFAAWIISKSFYEFDNISSYCQVYQKAYNKIASRLVNNNKGCNQNKHYKVFFQSTILKKLCKAYASLVAIMDTKQINYTSANLQKRIYKILQFLKADPLKIFYAFSTSDSSQSNKRPCLSLVLSACSHLICLFKRLHHPINKCWELHLKL